VTGDAFEFRTEPSPADGPAIRAIVASTGYFNDEEIAIAVELVEERLARGEVSGYHFLFADDVSRNTLGYTCFGRIPGTASSFDLYWIAVHESQRGRGLGRELLERSEAIIRAMGGTRVYIETSGRAQYVPTRGFYLRCGYHEAAVLADFYAPGDAKVIYARAL
jgi:ribosomal protein S18 acetylase RimI-like enzyme